jgi:RNA polymerase sigma-70 factor (ECF subfamily)
MAKRLVRVNEEGSPVLLADQDRSRWDHAAIAEGQAFLAAAVRRSGGVAGPYQLQAHLAACHSTAARWEATDWDRIVALYDLMLRLSPNPAVALNRAIAIGERDGPAAQLAARADALRRLGQISQAREELRAAAELAISAPERRLLAARLAALQQGR